MKNSELQQIIKEEVEAVISENFLKNLAQAGMKLFNKIRGADKMSPQQYGDILYHIGQDSGHLTRERAMRIDYKLNGLRRTINIKNRSGLNPVYNSKDLYNAIAGDRLFRAALPRFMIYLQTSKAFPLSFEEIKTIGGIVMMLNRDF